MSERLPYEMQLQQQWTDLPLPDENMAWADMKRRLDEDDDRPVIAWWRRGCGVWSVLLLALLAVGWWWMRPERWFTKTTQQEPRQEQRQEQHQEQKQEQHREQHKPSGNSASASSTPTGFSTDNVPYENIIVSKQPAISTRTNTAASYTVTTGSGRKTGRTDRDRPQLTSNVRRQPPVPGISNQPSPDTTRRDIINTVIQHDTLLRADTVIAKTDSVKKEEKPEEKSTPVAKTDSSKKKKVFFSAGIAVHQQIPLAGQKFTPYSSSGRKSSLADYIPSVYFRINRENKWFIQTEFRYGAPQHTKEIEYRNYTKVDTIAQITYNTNTKATVKKTFYHQLPVTFNYYVRPNWSVGLGFAWNKFSSAISDQIKVTLNNAGQTDSVLISRIAKVGRDSVFSSSYFQAVFETQYKWKRFSFGARYMSGMQPYIKFTLPGGTSRQEKNSSLQLFIRYELWRSGKK